MKGLLIKDLMLMKNQKQSFAVMFLVGIMFLIMNDNLSVAISYVTTMFSVFSISTISYDEFDNGMSFLFTLPVNRTSYVIEKYIFGILICLFGFTGISILTAAAIIVRKINFVFEEYLLVAVIGIFAAVLLMSIMIPLQLKFGAEKSRVVLLGTLGISICIAYVIVKVVSKLNLDYTGFIEAIENASIGATIGVILLAAAIVIVISSLISIKIMQKKEF